MRVIRSKEFTASKAWGAQNIANMNGITTRLHWTNQPYKWHVNDGDEVFAVLDGVVEMRFIESEKECSIILNVGDIFYADSGTAHVAYPHGEARILVIEKSDSV